MNTLRRRRFLTQLAAASAGLAVGLAANSAQAGRPHVAPGPGKHYPTTNVSISVERPDGSSFENFWLYDSRYIAGEIGGRYQLRLTNHSSARVEAVVTVDGRDVVSGAVGDYTTQRGYVLDPYGSVVIDGFRQSMSSVASFRFGAIQNSYSARRGTPQHVGVIGVAVFDEQPKPKPKPRPRPIQPAPAPDPYPYWYDYEDASAAEPSHDRRGGSSRQKSRAPRGGDAAPAPEAAPNLGTGYGRGGASSGTSSSSRESGRGADDYDRGQYAPPPRSEQLGTEYGESRYSRVREVVFKRRNRKKPDALITLYYDSYDGLRARGVPVDPPEPVYPYTPAPDPFPDRRFAPPPPPRRY